MTSLTNKEINFDSKFKTTSVEDTELIYTILRERFPENQIEAEFNYNTKEYTLGISKEKFVEDPEVPLDLKINIIYGDSVTGDTPILLRDQNTGMVYIKTIESIGEKWTEYPEFKIFDQSVRLEKQYAETHYEVWSDKGWNPIKKIIKHKTNKKIYRVLTPTGVVDVTEDHSLCTPEFVKIKPTELKVGSSLLHSFPNDFPEILETTLKIKKCKPISKPIKYMKTDQEDWRVITDYPQYAASTLGNIKNNKTNNVLKPKINNGYLYVHLSNGNAKYSYVSVHKLVALAFLSNEGDRNTVNHKNYDKTDNRVTNLEWATMAEQNKHKRERSNTPGKSVIQFDLNMKYIATFDTVRDAGKHLKEEHNSTMISKACRGNIDSFKGFIWKYSEESFENEVWVELNIDYYIFVVSNYGRVKSKNGRCSYGSLENSGYLRSSSTKNGTIKKMFVHVLVAKAFLSLEYNQSMVVNHKDGNKSNNHVSNLEWITPRENAIHSIELKQEYIQYVLTENEASIWGTFMANGNCSTKIYPSKTKITSWTIYNRDIERLNHFRKILEEIEIIKFEILEESKGVYKLVPKESTKYMVDKYLPMFYDSNVNDDKNKIVPNTILNASKEIKMAFWRGYSDGTNAERSNVANPSFSVKGKIGAQCMYYLMRSIGFNMTLAYDHKNEYFWLNQIMDTKIDETSVKKLYELKCGVSTEEFVYDIETEFGRFNAGVGKLTILNTDSVFLSVKFNRQDFELNRKDAFKLSIVCGDNLTKTVFKRPPIEMEFEKVYQPFVLLTKKRYIGKKFEDTRDPMKFKALTTSGIAITRRDYSYLVKKCYKEVIDCVMDTSDLEESLEIFKSYIEKIENYQVDFEDLIVSSTLAKNYTCSTCKEKCEWIKLMCCKPGCKENNVTKRNEYCARCRTKFKCLHTFNLGPVTLAVTMLKRNEEINVNDRIQYLLVERENNDGSKKAELAEDPRYAKEHKLKFNRICYLEQLAKPLLGFFLIVLKEDRELLSDIVDFVNTKLVEFGGKKLKVSDYVINEFE